MIVYQEVAPIPALRPWLDCVWTCRVRTGATPFTHRVLPDNCIDILCQDQQDASFAVGMMTAPITVVSQGLVQTVAARFKPGAAAHFFQLSLCELNDGRTALDQLWGRELAARLGDALWSDPLPDAQRVAILQDYLLRRLRAGPPLRAPGVAQHASRPSKARTAKCAWKAWPGAWACRARPWRCNFASRSASAPSCSPASAVSALPALACKVWRERRTGRKWPCNMAISTSRT